MTNSKNTPKNGTPEPQVPNDEEYTNTAQEETEQIENKEQQEQLITSNREDVIAPPKLPGPRIITREGQFQLQTNLPPEIALATLPYISSDERKLLINEIGKENERMFEAFKIFNKSNNRGSIVDKVYYGLFLIGFVFLMLYLLNMGYDSFIEKILTILLSAFGGGGYIIYYLHKKGKLS